MDLNNALDEALGTDASHGSSWRPLGFLRNPFPSRAHPIWDVFVNQVQVRERFYKDLTVFLRDSATMTLFFTGGNRVGKTHFMEHHRKALTDAFLDRSIAVPMSVASAQSCDFWQLYIQIIEQSDESLRIQMGAGLFERAFPQSVSQGLQTLPPGDLRRALEVLSGSTSTEAEFRRVLLRQWIRGERLRAPQRRELNVTGLLDSQAEVLNAFETLVKYLLLFRQSADDAPRCPGILVFLDEFELVWRHRRDRRDQFLQALRALIDACPHGMMLCVGMATGVGVDTHDVELSYPALFQRLKGVRDIPTLVQIDSVLDAIEYTRAFEKHGREQFQQTRTIPTPPKFGECFADREIEDLFRDVAGSGSASQGDYFDRLHIEAERKLAETTERPR